MQLGVSQNSSPFIVVNRSEIVEDAAGLEPEKGTGPVPTGTGPVPRFLATRPLGRCAGVVRALEDDTGLDEAESLQALVVDVVVVGRKDRDVDGELVLAAPDPAPDAGQRGVVRR